MTSGVDASSGFLSGRDLIYLGNLHDVCVVTNIEMVFIGGAHLFRSMKRQCEYAWPPHLAPRVSTKDEHRMGWAINITGGHIATMPAEAPEAHIVARVKPKSLRYMCNEHTAADRGL